MDARARCRPTYSVRSASDRSPRFNAASFPTLGTQRLSDLGEADSEERLRRSKQLWDSRWTRWWGHNWRRNHELDLRTKHFLDSRRRLLQRVESESDVDRSARKKVSFSSRGRDPNREGDRKDRDYNHNREGDRDRDRNSCKDRDRDRKDRDCKDSDRKERDRKRKDQERDRDRDCKDRDRDRECKDRDRDSDRKEEEAAAAGVPCKLSRLLSCAGQSIARRFKRNRSPRSDSEECEPRRPEPGDGTMADSAADRLRWSSWRLRCPPPRPPPPPADGSMQALERLSRRFHHLRTADSAPLPGGPGGGRPGVAPWASRSADDSMLAMERLSRRLESLRAADSAPPPPPEDRPLLGRPPSDADVERELSRGSLLRSRSRSLAAESRASLFARGQVRPVVANMQTMDSGSALRAEMKYDRSKLSTYQVLPFTYPHYPNVSASPGGGGPERRLFSSVTVQTEPRSSSTASSQTDLPLLSTVSSQTEHRLNTTDVYTIETSLAEVRSQTLRNSESQTTVPCQHRTTQCVDPSEPLVSSYTQTAEPGKDICLQMPSVSDMCLLEAQKAKDDETEVKACGSIVTSDSIKSVFGSNRTHVVIYRPELVGSEDSSDTIKLTTMEVFLPDAVSYDRYYAELTSDSKASTNHRPGTTRENGRFGKSVTPLMEVTSIAGNGEPSVEKKKKKGWLCYIR